MPSAATGSSRRRRRATRSACCAGSWTSPAASFYAWLQRGPSARAQADQQLLRQISTIHRTSRGTYGAPRVHAELRDDDGVRVGRKRVARLMRTHGLVGCHRRCRGGLTHPDPAAIEGYLRVRRVEQGWSLRRMLTICR